MTALRHGAPWAGLFAGPAAWAVSTQLNYILAPWGCEHDLQLVPLVAFVLALLALLGGAFSWRAWKEGGGDEELGARSGRFLAMLGLLMAAFFALVIVMQGSAAFVLSGCIR